MLLLTEAEDEEGEEEDGHKCTPEEKQRDVLTDGRDGGVDLQMGQVSRPLLGAAARVGAHALRDIAVERVNITWFLHVVSWRHLPGEYEHQKQGIETDPVIPVVILTRVAGTLSLF